MKNCPHQKNRREKGYKQEKKNGEYVTYEVEVCQDCGEIITKKKMNFISAELKEYLLRN